MSMNLDDLISSLTAGEAGGQEKQASETQETVAPSVAESLKDTLMTKSASERRTECEDMGRALAALLVKQAAEEEKKDDDSKEEKKDEKEDKDDKEQTKEASTDGEGAAQPNLSINANAGLAAEQTQSDAAAKQSGGTVDQQLHESLAKGLAAPGAGPDDKVEANMLKAAAVSELVAQGHDFYSAVNLVADADQELQKEAALNQLLAEGYGFEDAVALVKQASEQTFGAEEAPLTKQAQFEQLLSAGVPFDEAVAALKD